MDAEKGLLFLLRKAPSGATVTFTNTTNLVNHAAHGGSAGDPVIFTNSGGDLPAELSASTVYYIGNINTNEYTLHGTKAAGVAGTGTIGFTDDGTGTTTGKLMTVLAGQRTTGFNLSGEEVDITSKDSTSQWRELLAGAGVASLSISGSGVYADDAGLAAMRVLGITRALDTFMIEFESGDSYWGLFQVASLEHAGEFNGEVTYSTTLESSGVITLVTNA